MAHEFMAMSTGAAAAILTIIYINLIKFTFQQFKMFRQYRQSTCVYASSALVFLHHAPLCVCTIDIPSWFYIGLPQLLLMGHLGRSRPFRTSDWGSSPPARGVVHRLPSTMPMPSRRQLFVFLLVRNSHLEDTKRSDALDFHIQFEFNLGFWLIFRFRSLSECPPHKV